MYCSHFSADQTESVDVTNTWQIYSALTIDYIPTTISQSMPTRILGEDYQADSLMSVFCDLQSLYLMPYGLRLGVRGLYVQQGWGHSIAVHGYDIL